MRRMFIAVAILVAGCRKDDPPAPTAEQSDQLNEADSMLDNLANEEGPENRSPGPSDSQ